MFTKQSADVVAQAHLREVEREMDSFGSALPENKDRLSQALVITRTVEEDFGWVYFYNSREFVESGDFLPWRATHRSSSVELMAGSTQPEPHVP